jgi:CheY-like chemotaxis protein
MGRLPIAVVVNKEDWLARSIEAVLVEHGYVVHRSGSAEEALRLLATTRADAIILDRYLPDSDGAVLCRQLRENPRVGPSVPIAITSMVPLSAAERAELFRCGAWDLWGPLLEPEVFATKLDTFVSAKLAAEVPSSENLDVRTGLLSGQALVEKAREVGEVAKRLRVPLACIAIAPATGTQLRPESEPADDLFRNIAEIWVAHGRSADWVGRLSEGELGVIAPGSDSSGAVALVRRLQVLLAPPANKASTTAPAIRAGYCAATNLSDTPSNVPEMLQRASAAVRYAAGQRGAADILSYDDVPPERR